MITEQNKRSFVYALKMGRSSVVQPLFSDFPCTFGKQIGTILLDTYCFTADQLLTLFLERQAVFKDVYFSEIQMPLLLKTLDMDRLDLASSLLDCSTYHATPEELSTARGILAKELCPMSRRPWASEYLLHKIEMKERQGGRRRQEAA